jgi:lysophospholipase L1-like esterase
MPIIVIFAIGINDSCLDPWIQQWQTPIEEFKKAIHTMISYCQQRKYEVIVIWLTPVDESKVGTLFKNSTIQMYDAVLRTISQKESVKYIHVFDRFINQWLTDHLYDGLHPDTLWHQKLFEHFTHAMKDLSITFK